MGCNAKTSSRKRSSPDAYNPSDCGVSSKTASGSATEVSEDADSERVTENITPTDSLVSFWRRKAPSRCNKCERCIQEACGCCGVCRLKNGKDALCVQKMCLKVPEDRKSLPAPGFPRGWTFFFKEIPNGSVQDDLVKAQKGVVLRSPLNRMYRVAARAKRHAGATCSKADPEIFNNFAGIASSGAGKSQDAPAAFRPMQFRPKKPAKPLTVITTKESMEAFVSRYNPNCCGSCEKCTRDPCGRCASCSDTRYRGLRCLRKMCLQIPESDRLLPAPGFPAGWKFVFEAFVPDSKFPEETDQDGLKIVAPTNRHYQSVEAAKRHYHSLLADMNTSILYRFIGISKTRNSSPKPKSSVRVRQLCTSKSVGSRCYGYFGG